MKLLFDQNLSPRLATWVAELFPGSSHVHWIGLGRSPDQAVWDYARANQFMVVTKDADFSEMSMLQGFPPKVIWLRLGNCTTAEVDTALRGYFDSIRDLAESESLGILALFTA